MSFRSSSSKSSSSKSSTIESSTIESSSSKSSGSESSGSESSRSKSSSSESKSSGSKSSCSKSSSSKSKSSGSESSRSISSNINQNNNANDDVRNPPCTVYLYKRSIRGSSSGNVSEIPIGEHWVLYFDWGYYDAHYEAYGVRGKVEFSKGKGEPKTPDFTFIKEELQTIRVMPHTVDEEAERNRFNGVDYSVGSANCQHWAIELGERLGIQMPQGQVEELSTVASGSAIAVADASVLL
ncbi:putative uncharacterized protein DDB_G0277255 [Palaemon carinicauda]|uniref:putative uncharacterized protein DDB_G0277255 n=1 Tax=Palaemon carinicauda TaxID=392227 RepID=UPI0035B586C5